MKLLDLYELIHSLTSREKRYFNQQTLLSKKQSTPKYLKLYKLLEKQKAYSLDFENALYSSDDNFNGQTINYLYNLLLKTLRNLQSFNNSGFITLFRYIEEIELLIDKTLYSQAQRRVIEAKKLGFELNLFEVLLYLLKLERYLVSINKPKDHEKIILSIEEQTQSAIEMIKKVYQVHDFHAEIQESLNKRLKKISSNNQVLSDEEAFYQASSERLNIAFNIFASNFYRVQRDFDNALIYILKSYQFCQENPAWKNSIPLAYIPILLNTFSMSFHSGNEEVFVKTKKEILHFLENGKSKHGRLCVFKRAQSILCQYYIRKKDIKGLSDIMSLYGVYHDEFANKLKGGDLREYHFCRAIYYMHMGDFETASLLFDKSLKIKVTQRNDLYISARILNLICKYENGNDLIQINNEAKSLSTYLYKKSEKFNYCIVFTNFFINLKERNNNYNYFSKLLQVVNTFNQNSFEYQKYFTLFPLQGWIKKQANKFN